MKNSQQYMKYGDEPKGGRIKVLTWVLLLFGGCSALYMAIVDAIAYTHLSANGVQVSGPKVMVTGCTMAGLVDDMLLSPQVQLEFVNAHGTRSRLSLRTNFPDCGTAMRAIPRVIRTSAVNPQISMLEADFRALPLRFALVGMAGFGCIMVLAGIIVIGFFMRKPRTYRVTSQIDHVAAAPKKKPAEAPKS